MNKKPHHHIEQICNKPESALQTITQKVHGLRKLNTYRLATVAPDLAAHTQVANFRDGLLIIEVDNNVWVTQLRYAIPELKKNLRCFPELTHLCEIKWYIRPALEPFQTSRKILPVLSTSNVELLKQTAESISNPTLRNALQQLVEDAMMGKNFKK